MAYAEKLGLWLMVIAVVLAGIPWGFRLNKETFKSLRPIPYFAYGVLIVYYMGALILVSAGGVPTPMIGLFAVMTIAVGGMALSVSILFWYLFFNRVSHFISGWATEKLESLPNDWNG